MSTRYPAPSPRYAGPPAHSSGTDNKPIHRIVIHSAVCPCAPGWARKIAAYFRTDAAGGSAHYVVDPTEVVQAAYDSVVCWHAPPNRHSLGVEMCDQPSRLPGRWVRANQKAMLRRTARLVAELCLAYDVPPVYVGRRALKAGKHGVTTHAAVSAAFKLSTHWDPGSWPRRSFMRMVQAEVAAIRKEASK